MQCPGLPRLQHLSPAWAPRCDGRQTVSRRFSRSKTFTMTGRLLTISALLTGVVNSSPHQRLRSAATSRRGRRPARLNLSCIGSGQPVVILEADSGNGMFTWCDVQADIGRLTGVTAFRWRSRARWSRRFWRGWRNMTPPDKSHGLADNARQSVAVRYQCHSACNAAQTLSELRQAAARR